MGSVAKIVSPILGLKDLTKKPEAPKIDAPEPMPIADEDEKEKLRARQQLAAQAAASGRQSTMLVPANSGGSKLGGK